MKFFIDTAKVEDIREANDMGVICGVTTNPSLIAKEGRDFNEVIKEITTIVDGPISGEVKATTTDAEGMIREGREIAAILYRVLGAQIPLHILRGGHNGICAPANALSHALLGIWPCGLSICLSVIHPFLPFRPCSLYIGVPYRKYKSISWIRRWLPLKPAPEEK